MEQSNHTKESNSKKLTKIQRSMVDALELLGFQWKYFTTWELIGWGDINISAFTQWSDLLRYVHEQGKHQKCYEIQRALMV